MNATLNRNRQMPTITTRSSNRISVSSAKAKGRRLQQWVRNYLQQHLKGVEDDDVTSTPGGVNGPDIGLSPLARRLFPWTVECKESHAFRYKNPLNKQRNI